MPSTQSLEIIQYQQRCDQQCLRADKSEKDTKDQRLVSWRTGAGLGDRPPGAITRVPNQQGTIRFQDVSRCRYCAHANAWLSTGRARRLPAWHGAWSRPLPSNWTKRCPEMAEDQSRFPSRHFAIARLKATASTKSPGEQGFWRNGARWRYAVSPSPISLPKPLM